MKEVIAHYIKLANIFDEFGHTEEAQELTDRAFKSAQVWKTRSNPISMSNYKKMIEEDAVKAADLILKATKGEISKDAVKQELQSMMTKQQSFKFNAKITDNDDSMLLNQILKKNDSKQVNQPQAPVFRTVQEAENYYNQKHTFNSPQEEQRFLAEKARYTNSKGR